jgi:Heterokaryon incompatibility protein (HET)
MSLCALCLSIDFAAISRSEIRYLKFPYADFPKNHDLFYYRHGDHLWNSEDGVDVCVAYHRSLEASNSSAIVCGLCRLIANCVDATLANMQKAVKMNFGYPLSGYEFWLCGRHGADGFQVLGRHKDIQRCQLMGGIGFCAEEGKVYKKSYLHSSKPSLTQALEGPLSTVFEGRKISLSPTSPAVLRKIEGWISECREQHGHRRYQINQVPSRILEIKENGSKVVLCELSSMEAAYSALSHCWGTLQPVTLTTDNLEDFRMGVQTSSLPKTFQDAIWLADHLRIQYVWIDSLCIIQDDPDDWARESARMADIFGNSFLTIAACRAANTSEGFLADRPERTYLPIPACVGDLTGEVLAFNLPLKYVGDTRQCAYLEDEPLTERGWALQERYLACRTLHFGRSQIFFECDQIFSPEDGCSFA